MSSVNFKKNTTSAGKAMIGHFVRHDGDPTVGYHNKFINVYESDKNYCVGNEGDYIPTSKEIAEKLEARIREIDKLQPPKRKVKDRITIMTYTVAAPEKLSDQQEKEFFKLAYEEIAKMSGGKDNVSVGYVHRDEIHNYVGVDGQIEKSRSHLHVAGIPYTQEKGVNGKAFETRSRMSALNKAIDDRCRQELNIKFMTGERGLTGRTVEELQAASETRAIKQEKKKLRKEIQVQRDELIEINRTRNAVENDLRERQESLNDIEKHVRDASETLQGLRKQLGDLEKIKQFLRERIKAIQKAAKNVSVYEIVRKFVESKTKGMIHVDDKIGVQSHNVKGVGRIIVPTAKDKEFRWKGYRPAYIMGIGELEPAYIITPDNKLQTTDKWNDIFSPEKRDIMQDEKENSRDSLSEEIVKCESVIADIESIQEASKSISFDLER